MADVIKILQKGEDRIFPITFTNAIKMQDGSLLSSYLELMNQNLKELWQVIEPGAGGEPGGTGESINMRFHNGWLQWSRGLQEEWQNLVYLGDLEDLGAKVDVLEKEKFDGARIEGEYLVFTAKGVDVGDRVHIGAVGSGGGASEEVLDKRYVRKDKPDNIDGYIDFKEGFNSNKKTTHKDGIQIGDVNTGGFIDKKASAKLSSLSLSGFLDSPETRSNRVDTISGELWSSIALGLIEEVDEQSKIIKLKLENGELLKAKLNDFCRGVFRNPINNSSTPGIDSSGFEVFVGFSSVYFTPVEIISSNSFRYELKPGTITHPTKFMKFAVYGNSTDKSRQASNYRTKNYTRYLRNVNTWNVGSNNIAIQMGDLSNLSVNGESLSEGSIYLNHVYFGDNVKTVGGLDNDLNGKDAYSVTLSSYSAVHNRGENLLKVMDVISDPDNVKASNDQVITANFAITTQIQAYKGPKQLQYSNGVASEGKYTVVSEGINCKYVLTDGLIAITELSADNAEVKLKVNAEGVATYSLVFSIASLVDGEDGTNGTNGTNGKDGKDGKGYEYVFIRTKIESIPLTPQSLQKDDYVPVDWSDDPLGVSLEYPYEWVSQRTKKNNIWSEYTKPSLWAKFGEDGLNYEYIYLRTLNSIQPVTPIGNQENNNIPYGWTDNPTGPNREYPYEWVSHRVKEDGLWGDFSSPSMYSNFAEDGSDFEYIYKRTSEDTNPDFPVNNQMNDYVPEGWSDDPVGVDKVLIYEWVSQRSKAKGVWNDFSYPSLWAKYSFDGESSITVDLDNESTSVVADVDGNVVFGLPISVKPFLRYGTTTLAITNIVLTIPAGVKATYTLTPEAKIIVSEINKTSTDIVNIKAELSGKHQGELYTREVSLTIAKIKKGENAVIYELNPSESAIKKDLEGTNTPNVIHCGLIKTDGKSGTTDLNSIPSGYSMKYSVDNGTAKSYNINDNITVGTSSLNITFYLYYGNDIIDKEGILILSDGNQGNPGEPGEPGFNTATVTLHVRSAATPSKPTATATYNFGTAILSGIPGWTQAMPGDNGLPLWGITAFISSKEGVTTILASEWTNPIKIVEDGKPGSPGSPGVPGSPGQDGKFIRYVYKFAELKPAIPETSSLIENKWNNTPDQNKLNNILYIPLRSYNANDPNTDVGKQWAISQGWFTSPSGQLDAQTSVAKMEFTTTKSNQLVSILYQASTEPNSDYMLIGKIDTAVSEYSFETKVSGNESGIHQVMVTTTGKHYIEVSYTKDGSVSSGTDKVKVKVDYSPVCWISQAECTFNKTVWDWIPGLWSSPTTFIADSGDIESIYWLNHLDTLAPIAPDSQPSADDYAPPLKLSAANSAVWIPGKAINKGSVFYYVAFYYEAIANILSTDTSFPTSKTRRLYNWTDNPSGVRASDKYEWTCKRTKSNGVWGPFSTPAIYAKLAEDGKPGSPGSPGEQGLQGCIIQHTDWSVGFSYRNDLNTVTTGFRYLDLVHLAEDNDPTSWYQAQPTHNGVVSTVSNKPGTSGGASYWIKANKLTPIYTPLIIADNAYLKFGQGNQFLIQKNDGTITAGISGSITGNKTRIWAGSIIPDNAPFRVSENGSFTANDCNLTGSFQTSQGGLRIIISSQTVEDSQVLQIWDGNNKNVVRVGARTASGGFIGAYTDASSDSSGSKFTLINKDGLRTQYRISTTNARLGETHINSDGFAIYSNAWLSQANAGQGETYVDSSGYLKVKI